MVKKADGNFGNDKSFHSFAPAFKIMENKERISSKAYELFMRYGIRSVSMDDIAGQLGMSKKTIYQFFSDKDELVNDVLNIDIARAQTDCRHSCDSAENAVHEIMMTMDQIIGQFKNMNPMILYDLEKFHPDCYQKFLKHKNEFLLKIIRDNIERGISEELYRPEINVDVISKFRLESMMLAFNLDLYPPAKYSLADVTMQIMEHYMYGLATIKGYKMIEKYEQERNK